MDNYFPESIYIDGSRDGPELDRATVYALIAQVQDPQYRENAISLLSKKKSDELAQMVWDSFNTVYILLQEVIAVYKRLIPRVLTMEDTIRVCNAVALFQCIATNPDTRMPFLKAKIPVYLYPLINTTHTERPFEYLRLMSLGVLGALVKYEDSQIDPDVVHFLLETEVFPLCLRCMDVGGELSKVVATFVIAKILMQDEGLMYCCGFAERFYSVVSLLDRMVNNTGEHSSPKLLKNIIRCYLRLSGLRRACRSLYGCFPEKLRDPDFTSVINDDPVTVKNLEQLLNNLDNVRNSTRKMN